MNEERIEEGDCVNVHFTTSTSIFRAKIIHIPSATGDCWRLLARDGREPKEPINVMLFERMDLVRKGES